MGRDKRLEKQREANARWYDKNKAKLAARRKKRYEEDKEYRDKQVHSAREYRSRRREEGIDLTRVLNGKEVVVYPLSEVGVRIQRSASTIRKWEAEGVIPHSSFGGMKRVYSEHQVKLLFGLVKIMDSGDPMTERVLKKKKYVTKMKKSWGAGL